MEPLNTIKPELLTLTADQIRVLMPLLLVCGGGILAILGSVTRILKPKYLVFFLVLLTTGAAGYSAYELMPAESVILFNGMMVSDSFAHFFNILFLASAALTCLISFRYLDHEQLQHPEYYVLVLFSAIGMMLMVSALDLIV